MGVDRTDYIMVGSNVLSNKKYFKEIYGEYWTDELDSIKGLNCIYDGMNGNYAMLGKVISESEQYEGINFTKIDLEQIDNIKNEVKDTIHKKLNLNIDPELYVFTHWY